MVVYEEMWWCEDSELWEWLEECVGFGWLSIVDVRGLFVVLFLVLVVGYVLRKKRVVEFRIMEERI